MQLSNVNEWKENADYIASATQMEAKLRDAVDWLPEVRLALYLLKQELKDVKALDRTQKLMDKLEKWEG